MKKEVASVNVQKGGNDKPVQWLNNVEVEVNKTIKWRTGVPEVLEYIDWTIQCRDRTVL